MANLYIHSEAAVTLPAGLTVREGAGVYAVEAEIGTLIHILVVSSVATTIPAGTAIAQGGGQFIST